MVTCTVPLPFLTAQDLMLHSLDIDKLFDSYHQYADVFPTSSSDKNEAILLVEGSCVDDCKELILNIHTELMKITGKLGLVDVSRFEVEYEDD